MLVANHVKNKTAHLMRFFNYGVAMRISNVKHRMGTFLITMVTMVLQWPSHYRWEEGTPGGGDVPTWKTRLIGQRQHWHCPQMPWGMR